MNLNTSHNTLQAIALAIIILTATLAVITSLSATVQAQTNNQSIQVDVDPSDLPGDGTESNPYEISNISELQAMEDDLDANYELVTDIDASQTAQFNNGSGFDPVGNSSDKFNGSIEGSNHTVTGLTINRPKSQVGLFGVTGDGAIITNITLASVTLTGVEDVGGLVGKNDGGTIRNVVVSGKVSENDFDTTEPVGVTDTIASSERNQPDRSAPTIEDITILNETVAEGDPLVATVTVSDATGVEDISLDFQGVNTDSQSLYLDRPYPTSQNTSNGTYRLTWNQTVPQDTYRLDSVRVRDTLDNYNSIYPDGFSNPSFIPSDLTVTVEGPDDRSAPAIEDITILNETVSAGDPLVATVTVSDATGVEDISLDFQGVNTDSQSLYLDRPYPTSQNTSPGTYRLTWNQTVPQDTYRLDSVRVRDTLDNYNSIYPDGFSNPSFVPSDLTVTVEGPDDRSAPTIEDITILNETVAEDDPLVATVTVSDATGVEDISLDFQGVNADSQSLYLDRPYPTSRNISNGTYRLIWNQTAPQDTYRLDSVRVRDTLDNYNSIYPDGFSNPSFVPSDLTVELTSEPEVQPTSVTMSNQTVSNGSTTVTVDSVQFSDQFASNEEFVIVVHETTGGSYGTEIGPKVGESGVISPESDSQQDIPVNLSTTLGSTDSLTELTNSRSLVAMLHRADTDDSDNINHGDHITRDGAKVTDRAQITVDDSEQNQPDRSAPAIEDITILNETVSAGDPLVATVTVSDATGVEDIDLDFDGVNADSQYISLDRPYPASQNTSNGTYRLVWNETVPQDTYRLDSVSVRDTLDNDDYTNIRGFSNPSFVPSDLTVTVEGPDDRSPPAIEDITILNETVAEDDPLVATVTVSDATGVEDIDLDFDGVNADSQYISLDRPYPASQNTSNGTYRLVWNETVPQDTYRLDSVSVRDTLDNDDYTNIRGFSNPSFVPSDLTVTVEGPDDRSPPAIEDITILNETVAEDDPLVATVTVSDATGVEDIDLDFDGVNADSQYISLDRPYPASQNTSNGTYRLVWNETVPQDTYRLDSVSVRDTLDNDDYTNIDGFSNPSFVPSDLTVELTSEPEVQSTSVTMSNQTVSNGSTTVTVDSVQFSDQFASNEEFVIVVHETTSSSYGTEIGPKVGESGVISPESDSQQDIPVNLSTTLGSTDSLTELTNSQSLVAMLHRADTDDSDNINHGPHITRNGDKVTSRAQITVDNSPSLRIPAENALAVNGSRVYTIADDSIRVYNLDTRELITQYAAPDGTNQGLAYGDGSLWYSDADQPAYNGQLLELNPTTGEVRSRIDGLGYDPYGLAYGDGSLWAGEVTGVPNELKEYSPGGSELGGSDIEGPAGSAGPNGVAYFNGSIWIGTGTALFELGTNGNLKRTVQERPESESESGFKALAGSPTALYGSDSSGNLSVLRQHTPPKPAVTDLSVVSPTNESIETVSVSSSSATVPVELLVQYDNPVTANGQLLQRQSIQESLSIVVGGRSVQTRSIEASPGPNATTVRVSATVSAPPLTGGYKDLTAEANLGPVCPPGTPCPTVIYRYADTSADAIKYPDIEIGQNRTVTAGEQFTLNVSGSLGALRSDALNYTLSQRAGPDVELRDSQTATPEVVVPDAATESTLVFALTATDSTGASETEILGVTVRDQDREQATLKLQPQTVSVQPGETVTTDVVVNTTEAEALAGASASLQYNSSLFDATVSGGSFLSSDGANTTNPLRPRVNETAGTIDYAEIRLASDGVTGEGTLFTVTLEATRSVSEATASPLRITQADLSTPDQQSISSQLQNGTATIQPLPPATVEVQPTDQELVIRPTGTASVDVVVNTTQPLAAGSASLEYNTSLFNATVSGGSFLSSDGADTNTPVPPTVNETTGTIEYSEFRLTPEGITGEGALFTVVFEPTQTGATARGTTTPVTLTDVSLSTPDQQPVPTRLSNTTATIPANTPPTLNATLQTTTNNVGAPLTVDVNATDAETAVANLSLSRIETQTQTQTQTSTISESQPQAEFELTTTPTESSWTGDGDGYAARNYTVTASDTGGLTTTETVATPVYIPGDTNGDGVVDIFDAVAIGSSWKAQRGQQSYSDAGDLNNDGIINIFDAVAIGSNWQTQASVSVEPTTTTGDLSQQETGTVDAIDVGTATATANTDATLSVEPQTTTLQFQPESASTESFTVEVVATVNDSSQSVFGTQASLKYDTSVLNVTAVNSGSFLSADGVSTGVQAAEANETSGVVNYAETRQTTTEGGISGSGTLFTVTFEPTQTATATATQPTVSRLNLTDVILSTSGGDPVSVQLQNGAASNRELVIQPPSQIVRGEPFAVEVFNSAGEPVSGAPVTLIPGQTSGSDNGNQTATTNASGVAVFTLPADTETEVVELAASSDGLTTYVGGAQRTVVGIRDPGDLQVENLSVNSPEVTVGNSVTVSAEITNTNQTDLNQTLTITANNTGTLLTRTVTIPGNTTQQFSLTPTFSTIDTQTLSVNGQSAGTVTVTEITPPTPELETPQLTLSSNGTDTSSSVDLPAEVNATRDANLTVPLTNRGDEPGEFTLNLTVADGNGDILSPRTRTRTLEVNATQTQTVTFEDVTGGLSAQPTSYAVTVTAISTTTATPESSRNTSVTTNLSIAPSDANNDGVSVDDDESLQITDTRSPARVSDGDRFTVSARIGNFGTNVTTDELSFAVDTDRDGTFSDETTRTQTQTLPANETARVAFQATASSDSDSDSDSGQPPLTFRLSTDADTVTSNLSVISSEFTTAVSTGDPHIVSFDGVAYDFQAAGEFVLAREPTPNGTGTGSLIVQARQEPLAGSDSITRNTAVATVVNNTTVIIDATDPTPLQINGSAVELNRSDTIAVGNGTGEITRTQDGNTLTITYPGPDDTAGIGDERLTVDLYDDRVDIALSLDPDRDRPVEGVFGPADGNATNDIGLPNGTALAQPPQAEQLYGVFRQSWRVNNSTTLFAYEDDNGPETYYDPTIPAEAVSLADLDPTTRQAAEQRAIDAGLQPGTVAFRNAVLDVALTGDGSYLTSAQQQNTTAETTTVVGAPTESTVRVEPASASLGPGGTTNLSLILEQAPEGLAGYNLTASVTVTASGVDSTGVRVVGATAPDIFNSSVTETTIGPDNQTVEIRATDINTVVESNATDISLGTITVAANETADVSEVPVTVSVSRIDDDSGSPIDVQTQNGTVTVTEQPPLAEGLNPPTDQDNDGVFEDLNGNGRVDFNDVVILFENLPDAETPFQDVNGNGRIDFDDIVELFKEI